MPEEKTKPDDQAWEDPELETFLRRSLTEAARLEDGNPSAARIELLEGLAVFGQLVRGAVIMLDGFAIATTTSENAETVERQAAEWLKKPNHFRNALFQFKDDVASELRRVQRNIHLADQPGRLKRKTEDHGAARQSGDEK